MIKLVAAFLCGAFMLAALPAQAQEAMVWRPTTAAGGAPVNPEFWTAEASVRVGGPSANTTNVTVAPTQSTYNDYSANTNTNNFQGGQTNVSAQGNLTNGGTFTVTTQSGSPGTSTTASASGSPASGTSTGSTLVVGN